MATTTMTAHGAHVLAGPDRPGLRSRLVSAFARFEDWLERRRTFNTTVAQLSQLDDRILSDIGLERGDIPHVARQLMDKRHA